MHALIVTFRMDPAQLAANTAELHERVIPIVKHQPGFRSGYWTHDAARSTYVSFLAFATEEQARGVLAFIEADAPRQRAARLMFESAAVVEVKGHAAV